MLRSRSAKLLPINLEIECTLSQLRKENKRREEVQIVEMADDNNNQLSSAGRALWDYTVPIVSGPTIRRPTIQANNFELKPTLIQMV